MRLQWCRTHIDEVAEACNLSNSAKAEVKQAAKFCEEHSDFAELPTRPIMALIRVKDEPVRERAILHVKNALNDTLPTGGKKRKSLTEKEVKKIIEGAEREIRLELAKKYSKDRKENPPEDNIGSEKDPEPNKENTNQKPEPQKEPEEKPQVKKDKRDELAQKFLEKVSSQYLLMVNDLMRAKPEKYLTITDVICAAITALSEKES